MAPNAGATRRSELRAALVAIAVLAFFVGAFAVAGAFDDNGNRVTAGTGGTAGDDAAGASASPDATTTHQHDDAMAHDDSAHDHAATGTDAEATHSHDSADAQHDDAATGNAAGASHSHDSADASHDDTAHDTAHDTATHDDTGHGHDPAADPAAAASHPEDGHTHSTAATVPGDTTPTTHGNHEHPTDTTIVGNTTPTTEHSHPTLPVGTTIPGETTTTDPHHHGGPVVQLADLPADIQNQVTLATEWAQQYDTTAKATAAGFPKLTQYFPGIAAHYINIGRLFDNQPFDWQNPEVLLFNGTGPNAKLVGINYIVKSGADPPEGFPGDYDQWHEHANLCMQGGIVVGEVQPGQSCPAGQSTFSFKGFWLLHVWSIPGWDAPEGIFAHENSRV